MSELRTRESGSVLVYDFATLKELYTIPFDGGLRRIVFSPDSRRMAIGGFTYDAGSLNLVSGALELWNLDPRERVASQKAHRGIIQSLAFSPDGTVLATGSNDNWDRDVLIRLWDGRTGNRLAVGRAGHSGPITAVVFSPDGHTVLTASADHEMRYWDAATGRDIATMAAHRGPVSMIRLFPGSTRFLTASTERNEGDNTIAIWRFPATEPEQRLDNIGWVYDATPVSFERLLAQQTQGSSGKAINQYWRLPAAPELRRRYQFFIGGLALIGTAALIGGIFSRRSRLIRWTLIGVAVLCGLMVVPVVRTWKAEGPYDKAVIVEEGRPAWGDASIVAVSDDGHRVLTRTPGDQEYAKMQLWGQPEGRILREFPAGTSMLSGNGTRLVTFVRTQNAQTLTWQQQAIIADGGTGQVIRRITIDEEPWLSRTAIALSPNGHWLAMGGSGTLPDDRVWLWDTTTGTVAAMFAGHSGYIRALAFSPDSRTLASGSMDATVLLWPVPETSTGALGDKQ